MKTIKILSIIIFSIILASCSKDDDEDPFFRMNGINSSDFPIYDCTSNYLSTTAHNYLIYSGFKKGTDNYYIWICDKNYKILSNCIINIPRVIEENQGYGNIINCELASDTFFIWHIGESEGLEIYGFEVYYYNSKSSKAIFLFYNGKDLKPITTHTTLSGGDMEIKPWYNYSILAFRKYGGSNIFCFTNNGDLLFEWEEESKFFRYLNSTSIIIPLDYTKYISIKDHNGTDSDGTKILDLYLILGKEDICKYYKFPSPFESNEDFIVNSSSLLESKDNCYILECEVTAYSGEKKRVKIEINPNEGEIIH